MTSALRFEPDIVILGFCLNDAEYFPDRETRVAIRSWLEAPEPSPVSQRLAGMSVLYGKAAAVLEARRIAQRNRAYLLSLYREEGYEWKVCRESLQSIGWQCRSRNIPILIVIFPLFYGKVLGRGYPFTPIHHKVAAAARDIGFDVLDLLPAFEGIRTQRLVAHPTRNFHPNEMAHRIAADAIFDRLIRMQAVRSFIASSRPPERH